MQIDIYKAIFELEKMVSDTPLSEADRNKHSANIRAITQVTNEWNKLKEDAKENK